MVYIGLDISAGVIRSVIFLPPQHRFGWAKTLFQSHHYGATDAQGFLSELTTHIDSFLARLPQGRKLAAIGLGSPGPLDPARTKLLTGVDLKLQILIGVNLAKELEAIYKVPVIWERVGGLFTLAESSLGLARGSKSVLGVQLDSNLQAGFCFQVQGSRHPGRNYQIYNGSFNSALELGHTVIQQNGYPCPHHRLRGCLNQYAAEEFLTNIRPDLTIQELHRRINLRYAWAEDILIKMAESLGQGLINAINVLDPHALVIGGTLLGGHAGQFLEVVETSIRKGVFSKESAHNLQFFPAKLGEYAAAIGALVNAHQQIKKEAPKLGRLAIA